MYIGMTVLPIQCGISVLRLRPTRSPRDIRFSGASYGAVDRTAAELSVLLDQHAATIPHLLVLGDSDAELRSWAGAGDCGGLSGLRIDECLLLPSSQWCKRAMDVLLTVCGGFVLLPFLRSSRSPSNSALRARFSLGSNASAAMARRFGSGNSGPWWSTARRSWPLTWRRIRSTASRGRRSAS